MGQALIFVLYTAAGDEIQANIQACASVAAGAVYLQQSPAGPYSCKHSKCSSCTPYLPMQAILPGLLAPSVLSCPAIQPRSKPHKRNLKISNQAMS